jgi:hypothetical protein
MGDAAVTNIGARGFDESFADIGMPGLQSPHEQQVDQKVKVGGHGLAVHAKGASEFGGVKEPGLVMR